MGVSASYVASRPGNHLELCADGLSTISPASLSLRSLASERRTAPRPLETRTEEDARSADGASSSVICAVMCESEASSGASCAGGGVVAEVRQLEQRERELRAAASSASASASEGREHAICKEEEKAGWHGRARGGWRRGLWVGGGKRVGGGGGGREGEGGEGGGRREREGGRGGGGGEGGKEGEEEGGRERARRFFV